MISDDLGIQLHDRWTQGETLNEAELLQLTAWYAAQDEAEAQSLNLAAPETDLATLQAQIDTAVEELAVLTRHVQEKTTENNKLRREISNLSHQLALQKQPA